MEEGGGGEAETYMEDCQQEGGSTPISEGLSSNIFYKGSIADAIRSSQTERKILIVFVAGEDDESVLMEQTTFQLSEVVDEVQKQSLLLRMQEGSTDAAHFSAIYPLRRVPTITLIGHQGSVLYQLEGYQKAEEFLGTLQQAVASYNMQLQRAAAASALIALLSSANMTPGSTIPQASEPQLAGNSIAPSLPVPSSPSPDMQALASQMVDTPSSQSGDVPMDIIRQGNTQPTDVSGSPNIAESRSVAQAEALRRGVSERESADSAGANTSSSAPKPEAMRGKPETSRIIQGQGNTGARRNSEKKTTLRREPSGGKQVRVRTGPFLLQIRLTNGETIQGTFESYQLLRDVKNFVDLQRTDGNMDYLLAIPFPRKMLTEEDLGKTLTKLDIGPRSALILVGSTTSAEDPTHYRASANQVAASTSQSSAPPAGGSYVGKLLSYLNPFGSGRSGASADQQRSSSTSAWQNNANPAMARALREGLQPPVPNSSQPQPSFATPYNGGPNQKGDSAQTGSLSQRKAWGGGGNVHTLQQEDEGPPNKGNTYWNGNSTQFGGNDEAKED